MHSKSLNYQTRFESDGYSHQEMIRFVTTMFAHPVSSSSESRASLSSVIHSPGISWGFLRRGFFFSAISVADTDRRRLLPFPLLGAITGSTVECGRGERDPERLLDDVAIPGTDPKPAGEDADGDGPCIVSSGAFEGTGGNAWIMIGVGGNELPGEGCCGGGGRGLFW